MTKNWNWSVIGPKAASVAIVLIWMWGMMFLTGIF
jgi:hypothetical protein